MRSEPRPQPVESRSELPHAAPHEVGLAPDLRGRLRQEVERQREAGLTNGMQMFVARQGRTVIDESVGLRATDSKQLTSDTRLAVYSAGKPVVATAVHLMAERGLLAYSDRLDRHLPEFVGEGKGAVTIRHCFLHLAGLPDQEGRISVQDHEDWATAVAKICALDLEYEPGSKVDYHPVTASTLLAEVVRRLDGRSFDVFCGDEIFGPLGMSRSTWGLRPQDAHHADRTLGAGEDSTGDLALRAAVVPGASLFSTAHDLGRFYLCWGNGGRLGDARLLSRLTVDHATSRHVGRILGAEGIGLGYGFFVGAEPSVTLSRGHLCSQRTFGHPGSTSAVAFCDPEADLVVAFIANRSPGQAESDRRFAIMSDHVYRAMY